MTRLRLAGWLLLALAGTASARRPPASPPPPPPPHAAALTEVQLAVEILARSPAGQAARGVRRSGIFDVNNPMACSRWAAEALLARSRDPPARLLGNEEMILDRAPGQGPLSMPLKIGPLARDLEKDLRAAWDALRRAGDPVLEGRHLCVGLAASVVASTEATQAGFLLFDPQIYYDLNRFPGRTMRTSSAIAAHQLAHPLQVWTGDPVLDVTSPQGEGHARRTELQADCAGAALVAALAPEIGNAELWKVSRPGLRAAFAGLGDLVIFDRDHHGLAQERSLVAEHGIRLIEKLGRPGRQKGLLAAWLLAECRGLIDRMDARYGVPWPATADLP